MYFFPRNFIIITYTDLRPSLVQNSKGNSNFNNRLINEYEYINC